MRSLVVILIALMTHCVQAQSGFIKVFDESKIHSADFMDVLIENDTIILYSLAWDSLFNQGIRFAKLDTLGNILSEEIYVDSLKTLTTIRWRKKIIKTSDGGYMIAGSAQSTPYLLKVHHDLSLDFLKFYENPVGVAMSGNSSLLEVNGGYLLTGVQVADDFEKDTYLLKTDKSGNQIWRRKYGKLDIIDIPINLNTFGENAYILTGGRSDDQNGNQSTWTTSMIIVVDSLGNEQWEWESPTSRNQSAIWDFELLPDSSWICISGTWELNSSGQTYWTRPMVFRMDKDFNVLWERIYPIQKPAHFFTDLEQTADGNFLASGWMNKDSMVTTYGSVKGMHFKFNIDGDTIWTRQDSIYPDSITGYDGTRVTGTALLSSGSIISVGYAERNSFAPPSGTYGFVMKISPGGCVDTDTLGCWVGAVAPDATVRPLSLSPIQVYPNPVNDELTVVLPSTPYKETTIYFYDATGRFLRKQRVRSGRNLLSVSDLPQGMIFYTVLSEKGILSNGKLWFEKP